MFDTTKLVAGLTGSASLIVQSEHTAEQVGSGKIAVLATPVLINLFEAAALECAEGFLDPGFQTLGTHLDIRHIAATPVGMRARAEAELVSVDGRTLSFELRAYDDDELIGDGRHQRVVVNVARFEARVARKSQSGTPGDGR